MLEKELVLVNEGHWTKPDKDGNGVRYYDGKGDLVIINKGNPSACRAVTVTRYTKIAC